MMAARSSWRSSGWLFRPRGVVTMRSILKTSPVANRPEEGGKWRPLYQASLGFLPQGIAIPAT